LYQITQWKYAVFGKFSDLTKSSLVAMHKTDLKVSLHNLLSSMIYNLFCKESYTNTEHMIPQDDDTDDCYKVRFTLGQAMKAQRGSRGIALLSLTSAPDGGGWSTPHPSRFIPRNDPVPIVQEAGQAAGLVWIGDENLTPTGI
jgi:hypothetical protein